MDQKSAYEQLEYLYEKTDLPATCYTSNLFCHVAVHQFQNMTQSKAFLQVYEQYVDTQIATVSLPTPQTINDGKDKIKEMESIFIKYPKIDIYAFKHCDLALSVSYVKFLEAFAITHNGNTQFFNANHQFAEKRQFDYQKIRVYEIAQCFFDVIRQLSPQAQESLKLDLENRSIIGMYCYKWILWVGIVDHYGKQPLHHPDLTKDFLDHYGFQLVQVVCYKNVEYKNFDEICNNTRNQHIFDFNDMDRGTTLYLWSDKNYIGNYYISHKHYEILNEFKQLIQKDKRQMPSNFLAKYDLSQGETDFYWRYFGEFNAFNPETSITFSTLTSNIFNRILLNLRRPQKLEHRYSLGQCINPQAVVIIPIGFYKNPFFTLYDQLMLNPYSTILMPDKLTIDYKHQIYCYGRVIDYASFLELSQTLKKYKNTQIVGLFQVSKLSYKLLNGKQLPFSLEFIIYCLLQSTEKIEEFENSLFQLAKFFEIDHSKLKTNNICECNLIPNEQEIKKLIAEYNLEHEFQQLFNKDIPLQTIFEKFRKISQHLLQENSKFYQEESHCIVRRITQITQIFFKTSKQQNFNQIIYSTKFEKNIDQPIIPKHMYFTRESWSFVEDYIADVIDIIVDRSKQGNSQINKEIMRLKDAYFNQIFHKGQQCFFRNNQPFVLNVQELEAAIVIQLCIIVMDGLIILIPERRNLISHLLVMTQQLESECAQQVLDLIKEKIEKLSTDSVVEQSSVAQQFSFRNKDWNAYIVKFHSPKIILQQQ